MRDVRIGIAGHRRLDDASRIEGQLLKVMRRLSEPRRDEIVRLVLQTCLAEGADTLAAEVLLRYFQFSGIEVILPLDVEEYLADFSTAAARRLFGHLLDRAEAVVSPRSGIAPSPGTSSRQAAYLAAGRRVVERSEAVIAVWDGQRARGPGGTADIVALARQSGKPVLWISSTDPIPVRRLGPEGGSRAES